jgi:hypothetical protein
MKPDANVLPLLRKFLVFFLFARKLRFGAFLGSREEYYLLEGEGSGERYSPTSENFWFFSK